MNTKLLLCIALFSISGCTTQSARTIGDPIMHGIWSRTTLFSVEGISATRSDLVTVSLKVFDPDSGKQVGAPVVVVRAGESFGVAMSVPQVDASPVPDESKIVLDGKVQITSDDIGRRIAEYQISGRDRAGRQHKTSGSMRL